MSHFCSLLSKIQRKRLIYGYLRLFCTYNIPLELSDLCLLFYNDIIDWKIEHDEMLKFYELTEYDSLKGPIFNIKGFKFQLELYPKGRDYPSKGYVLLSLKFTC